MTRIMVVGGGLLGMLTARELAVGNNQVTLIERGEMARESSWAGGGIISPLYPWRYPDSITSLASWSQRIYPELCDALGHSTGIDPEYTPSGFLLIAPNETGRAKQWADLYGKKLDLITREDFYSLEPALAAAPENAIWMPDVAHVRNPRLARALVADIQQLGVTLLTGKPVTGLSLSREKVSGVETADATIEADAVVVCTGAWTGQLLNKFLPTPEIHPVRGQMLLFRAKPGIISRIVLEKNRYVIPRRDGRILFGSTIEEVGFEKETTEAALKELYTIATERFPVLKRYPVEKQWAGLRPASPGGIPYITAHPELAGLYINAGHYRNGVVLGPASARLMADIVTGSSPILPAEPYTLDAIRG
ncbi:MAG: glycine oxidase ThiO [Pseudomonadota bacterium]